MTTTMAAKMPIIVVISPISKKVIISPNYKTKLIQFDHLFLCILSQLKILVATVPLKLENLTQWAK
jgi:hypothetical protein